MSAAALSRLIIERQLTNIGTATSGRYEKGSGGQHEKIERAKTTVGAQRAAIKDGFTERVNYGKAIDVTLPNAINAQLSELSEKTGLTIYRVHIYTDDDEDGDNLGYHQASVNTMGFNAKLSNEYLQSNQVIHEGDVEKNIARLTEQRNSERVVAQPKLQKLYDGLLENEKQAVGCKGIIYTGNGTRIPTIDHEFAHALIDRETYPAGQPQYDQARFDRLDKFADECHTFAKEEKFSAYAIYGRTIARVEKSESVAEVYAYWKSGNAVPVNIVSGFERMEKKP